MKAVVVAVNYRRGLVAYEIERGDYGYFEVLGSDDFEVDEPIYGNLTTLGDVTVTKVDSGEKVDVYVEDFGMTHKRVIQQISN